MKLTTLSKKNWRSRFGFISILAQQLCPNWVELVVQWNLDLRKIFGVDKIFLKSRFFLISNTRRNPWESIRLQNECLKQYKYLIALTLSNASDYICRYFVPYWKIWKYFFENFEKLTFFFLKLLWNCQKVPIF